MWRGLYSRGCCASVIPNPKSEVVLMGWKVGSRIVGSRRLLGKQEVDRRSPVPIRRNFLQREFWTICGKADSPIDCCSGLLTMWRIDRNRDCPSIFAFAPQPSFSCRRSPPSRPKIETVSTFQESSESMLGLLLVRIADPTVAAADLQCCSAHHGILVGIFRTRTDGDKGSPGSPP